ncbi:MAG: DNA translocase FtsK [Clostridia bacterium]|nr:DNA translocase FtsK [Clostridia bacterium]
MAQSNKKKPVKNTESKKKLKVKNTKQASKPAEQNEDIIPSLRIINQIMPAILILLAIYLVICYIIIGSTGIFGIWLKNIFYGLFSYGAWAIPVILIVRAFTWKDDADSRCLGARISFSIAFVAGVSMLCEVFAKNDIGFSVVELFHAGVSLHGGGVIGGLIAEALLSLVGVAGTLIITFALVFVCGLFMLGITPYMIWIRILYSIKKHREDVKLREQLYAQEQDEKNRTRSEAVLTKREKVEPKTQPKEFEEDFQEAEREPIDSDIWEKLNALDQDDDNATTIDQSGAVQIEPPVINDVPVRKAKSTDPHAVDLDYIFGDKDTDASDAAFDEKLVELENDPDQNEIELTIERSQIGTIEESLPDPEPLREYTFPPITLLKKDTSLKNQDVSEELKLTATKLVETLKSYKINTKLVSISRGPSITRYELSPEIGTKVNSITNRIDDISLHLAASGGVRIVAPIPGMEAVGVEVPNKNVSLVYIRELLENEEFKKHPSKIHVALGKDVTGSPVFMDIAKMPHLLIAGATGMGKSVCINSTIISILYKATPDEVKLILIDPKQVEFTMYDGIPHLLVPVVTDPKKAAGTLHWAVTEMERRYELINGASVRNIHGYNEKMKDDPDAEYMPQIVIIIDELADLMLTASNDVDESIRRLSAKARAAGIHLILGTQRPSVDVITGTIKSNIPYRIAFTTTSYVDSRTIIDTVGAEKLIGKGDMLYAATGRSPIRVQGAFVSDEEVEQITSFVKETCGGANYNAQVVESIEREAELCGNKKSTTLGDGELDNNSGDPMLKPAIEIAVESGKISTSLLQRKLSIGFGRAAKLIDIMTERGIVSPPDGQKPRTTLWTKQQYMESIVKGSSFDDE